MVPDHLLQLAVGEKCLGKTPCPSVLHLITTVKGWVWEMGRGISVYMCVGEELNGYEEVHMHSDTHST